MTRPVDAQSPEVGQPVVRLICLPYAGGGTAGYYRWRAAMPASAELLPVCLPGREARKGESPATDLQALSVALADEFEPRLDRPYVLLGHSMGAWLAFELARQFRHRGLRLPELLVVAASRAPHVPPTAEPIHALPDQQFLQQLEERFGGFGPPVGDHQQLIELLMPILRADVQMVETYRCEDRPPLDVEILALGGTDDRAVSATELALWRRHTTRKFSARLVPGDHFFLFRGAVGQPGDTRPEAATNPAVRMIVRRLEQLVECR